MEEGQAKDYLMAIAVEFGCSGFTKTAKLIIYRIEGYGYFGKGGVDKIKRVRSPIGGGSCL